MKTIPGFLNYKITKDGRIWSKSRKDKMNRTVKGKWLSSCDNGDGHLVVRVSKDGKSYKKLIHRLVLETYVGKCPKGLECRHLNGNPKDNRLSNLCWGTKNENMQDRKKHGTDNSGERCGSNKLTWKIVNDIKILFIRKCPVTNTRLAERFGVSPRTISDIRRNVTWQES